MTARSHTESVLTLPGPNSVILELERNWVSQQEKLEATADDILRQFVTPITGFATSQTYGIIPALTLTDDENAHLNATVEARLAADVDARMTQIRTQYGSRLIDVTEVGPHKRSPVSGWDKPTVTKKTMPGDFEIEAEIWTYALSVNAETYIEYRYFPE